MFYTVHRQTITQYKPRKCIFVKLIYEILIVDIFYIFRTRGFIFRKTVVYIVTVWYSVLYSFFWVIPRLLNFMSRRFGTLFNLHRWCKREEFFLLFPGVRIFCVLLTPPMEMEQTECFETSAYKIQTPGNHLKERI